MISVLQQAVFQRKNRKENHPTPKGRREYRQNAILPILEEYFCWPHAVNPEKGSELYDAATYARNQKAALMALVDYGDVTISNNPAENAIRPFTPGRKNWLFCDSVKGAEAKCRRLFAVRGRQGKWD